MKQTADEMTDRELLELAAKAIGYKAHFNLADACQLWAGDTEDGYIKFWNPIEYGNDALELAVRLKLNIEFYSDNEGVYVNHEEYAVMVVELFTPNNHDKATRRAIVRAAAEIGKGM